MKISVSFMKSVDTPRECIRKLNSTNIDYLHVDLMDGKFVKEKNYTLSELKSLLSISNKKLDIHLMTKNPLKYIDELALLNVEYISFHYEAVSDPKEIIDHLKELGIKVGMAIKPKTKVKKIKDLLPILDLIIVMGVEPGKGGQQFIPEMLDKISELSDLKLSNGYEIAVDGGINEENITGIKNAGTDIIISGSFITMQENYDEQINKLLRTK